VPKTIQNVNGQAFMLPDKTINSVQVVLTFTIRFWNV